MERDPIKYIDSYCKTFAKDIQDIVKDIRELKIAIIRIERTLHKHGIKLEGVK